MKLKKIDINDYYEVYYTPYRMNVDAYYYNAKEEAYSPDEPIDFDELYDEEFDIAYQKALVEAERAREEAIEEAKKEAERDGIEFDEYSVDVEDVYIDGEEFAFNMMYDKGYVYTRDGFVYYHDLIERVYYAEGLGIHNWGIGQQGGLGACSPPKYIDEEGNYYL